MLYVEESHCLVVSCLRLSFYYALCLSSKTQQRKDAVERKHKEEQFQKQQDEEIALKEKLNNLNDKDYIEKVARDDYYLSNKGEVIFRLPNDNKSSKAKSSDENN